MMADLYTITLINGTILRYTDADGDLVYGGNTFYGTDAVISNLKISRDRTKVVVGIQVDVMTVVLHVDADDLIGGIPFPQFAFNGGFDGATVQVDRCFMATYGDTSAGIVNIFNGDVSDVKPSRYEITLAVSSKIERLNIMMPRNIYQPGCTHTVYDAGCGIVKASFSASTACASGSNTSMLNCALSQAIGWFDTGTISFTSGGNTGVSRSVKSYTVGVFNLSYPLPFLPLVGDTFVAYAGCDKTQATCTTKFSNVINFRGFPYIPVPEASI